MNKSLLYLLTFLLAVPLAACRNNPPAPSGAMLSETQRKAVLAFSEDKMDSLLAGWNDGDYAVFSNDFDQAALKSLTEEQFKKLREDPLSGLGRFYSREVESVVQRNDGSYTVIYYAVFENDDEVLLRAKFEAEEPHRISGLSFEK